MTARTRGSSHARTTTATAVPLPDPVTGRRLLVLLGAVTLAAATLVFGVPITSGDGPSDGPVGSALVQQP